MKQIKIILLLVCACYFSQAQTNIITTFAGTGLASYGGDGAQATLAKIRYPEGLCLDTHGNMYIADAGNNRVRKIDLVSGIISTVGGIGSPGYSGDDSLAINARFLAPVAVFNDTAGNIFVADAGNHRIRKIDLVSGIITTVAGSGPSGLGTGSFSGDGDLATKATLNLPSGIFIDRYENIFIADYNNNRVRKVDKVTGIITTIAGNGTAGYSGDGGLATNAQLSGVAQVFGDTSGNIFICDQWNHAVRKINTMTGIISTIAGTGVAGYSGDNGPAASATLNQPSGIFIDKTNNIFISEYGNGTIRRIDASTDEIETIAGTGSLGYSGDEGPSTNAKLRCADVFLDDYGTVYIADMDNNRIRKVYNPYLSVNTPNPNDIVIYPNPADREIILKGAKNSDVKICNLTGLVVYRAHLNADEQVVNVVSFHAGMYLVELTSKNSRVTKRLVITK